MTAPANIVADAIATIIPMFLSLSKKSSFISIPFRVSIILPTATADNCIDLNPNIDKGAVIPITDPSIDTIVSFSTNFSILSIFFKSSWFISRPSD